MRLYEYEAKSILKEKGIAVPESCLISAGDVPTIAGPMMLKAQVPIGGRGKAGGVLSAADAAAAGVVLKDLFGRRIRGYDVHVVLAEKKAAVAREYFLAITYDSVAKLPVVVFSKAGGVDVEDVSRRDPGAVVKRHFSARSGLPSYTAREIVVKAGIGGKAMLQIAGVLTRLAGVFTACDATLAEINPLAQTVEGRLAALDCHLDIDEDALFRQPAIKAQLARRSKDPNNRQTFDFVRRAAAIDALDHRGVAGRMIEFSGRLGLIIGGGGASLTAFDAVSDLSGQPANYCEIGGNPSVRKVAALTRLILEKPGVEKIAVIMNVVSNTRVDLVARGIIKGILETGRTPAEAIAVFRVPGSWEEEGFTILDKYGVTYCDRRVSIDEAAAIAVKRMGDSNKGGAA